MAKIAQEVITITLSELIRDNSKEAETTVISDDQLETLQAAVEGLLENPSVVVEVSR